MAVLEDLSQLAIGLCNEAVVLIKGDIAREKNSKQILLQPEGENPVTGTCHSQNSFNLKGLGFRCESGKSTVLFVVTSSAVCVYDTSSKDIYKVL